MATGSRTPRRHRAEGNLARPLRGLLLLAGLPGTFGARVSPLHALLKDGHKGVRLTDDEMHRLVLWMDCNCMLYSATTELERQAAGDEVLPRHE